MISYNKYDMEVVRRYDNLRRELGVDLPTDEEVWAEAREFENIPIFENIYIDVLLSRIADEVRIMSAKKGYDPDIEVYVNARDSSIYVNDKEPNSLEELIEAFEERGV